ncbi:MAG: hypothetical protein RML94_05465 [Bacteroidia bacterium]|nr:hypothetical protein [Bacteroidia bacterium]
MGVPLRCASGRRAAGCAIASVLRYASHRADARPPHASRNDLAGQQNLFVESLTL